MSNLNLTLTETNVHTEVLRILQIFKNKLLPIPANLHKHMAQPALMHS